LGTGFSLSSGAVRGPGILLYDLLQSEGSTMANTAIGNTTDAMIFQSTIPVPFVTRAVLAVT
jgi:hypothetical protein